MSKLSVCIVSRNDDYGWNLIERSTHCLNSMISTFDEVWYVDWNSPLEVGSVINEIKPNLNLKGNLHHIVIPPDIASLLTNNDPDAAVCCEVLGRNIGIRRATGDYIVSSNIDIIAPTRKDLDEFIKTSDINTFYTISRRHIELKPLDAWFGKNKNEMIEPIRGALIVNSKERHFDEKVTAGDDYSLINCSGDFQWAHKNIWNTIRGFEEDLIYVLYSDTNVQKKAVMHGFDLKAVYSPALFHIDHGPGGAGFMGGINKRTNDMNRAVNFQHETYNEEDWGLANTEIEYEVL